MSPDIKDDLPLSSIGSTYLVNRNVKLKYPKVANMNLYKDNVVFDRVRDVLWNEDNVNIIDEHYQEVLIRELEKVEVDEAYKGTEVCISLTKDNGKAGLFEYDEKRDLVVFNFAKFAKMAPLFYNALKSYLKGGDQLVLNFTERNEKFLCTFIRFYLYHHGTR